MKEANITVWELGKKYYCKSNHCKVCDELVKNIGVVVWMSDFSNNLFCVGCHKAVRHFVKVKSLMLVRLVDERPKGSVIVLRPFVSLVDSVQVSSDTVGDCEIVDRTVFSGRESFEGFSIGYVSDPLSLALDKELMLEDKRMSKK